MKTYLVKLKRIWQSGNFFSIIFRFLHRSVFPVYIVRDSRTYNELEKCRSYRKLKKRYVGKISSFVVNSEKQKDGKADIIWIMWLQGYENAPPLVKACIRSVKENNPNMSIIVLSKSNLKEYIKLPQYIEAKYEKGYISAAHYSDLVRISLLCQYGGTWIDATVLCTQELPSEIQSSRLFVFKEMDLSRNRIQPIVASSWFISAVKSEPILMMTRNLLFQYWKDYNSVEHYFLFHMFFALSTEYYSELWEDVSLYNNHSPHVLMWELGKNYTAKRWEQIMLMSPIHKLTHHIVYDNKNSFYQYIIDRYGE